MVFMWRSEELQDYNSFIYSFIQDNLLQWEVTIRKKRTMDKLSERVLKNLYLI